ncbi:MAG: hypothetical protein M1816_002352 [Peltula sp. TS41687]|nr:MAG: hypothetical protein M1816_002352 [Peltula sp. TS41687]
MDESALDTLTVFLVVALNKKFTDPSSDIINVIAGLDQVDTVFTDFVSSLDHIIRHGRNYVEDIPSVNEPFILLGILANYNKFEFQNPYRLRLDDFVNETIIQKIIESIGRTCSSARDRYVDVQDDSPEEWSLSNTLTYLGLGSLSFNKKPTTQTVDEETAKRLFAQLPPHSAATLLSTYDFAHANKLFCFNMVNLPSQTKTLESPFGAYLSLTSYLFNHAHRTPRTGTYAYLNLLVLRILVEDQVLCKHLCGASTDETKLSVRLCRQRQPFLPLLKEKRIPIAIIMDILIDGINHNLRRRLDVDLYLLAVRILYLIISFLSRSRTRLQYHYDQLHRTLLSLLKFLSTYSTDLKHHPSTSIFLSTLTNLLLLSIQTSDNYLPTQTDADDLIYKLVESGEVLFKFRDVYDLATKKPTSPPTPPPQQQQQHTTTKPTSTSTSHHHHHHHHHPNPSITTLIRISDHYKTLLDTTARKTGRKTLSAKEVGDIIRSGHESLSLSLSIAGGGGGGGDVDGGGGGGAIEVYREVEEKSTLKRSARLAVDDVRELVLSGCP